MIVKKPNHTSNESSAETLENIEKKLTENQNKWKFEMKENASRIESRNDKAAEENTNHAEK